MAVTGSKETGAAHFYLFERPVRGSDHVISFLLSGVHHTQIHLTKVRYACKIAQELKRDRVRFTEALYFLFINLYHSLLCLDN